MTRGGLQQPRFAGHQTVATVDALEAFVRAATPNARFTYCEAPSLIRCETSERARALSVEGLVTTHNERRAGGGWTYFVVRTHYKRAPGLDPIEAALADAATESIFRALKRAANFAQRCPSDEDLRRTAGLTSRHQAAWRVRKLIDLKLIGSTLAYDGGVPSRVVTIAEGPHAGSAAGKSTALPTKWAELRRAAEREMKSAGEGR